MFWHFTFSSCLLLTLTSYYVAFAQIAGGYTLIIETTLAARKNFASLEEDRYNLVIYKGFVESGKANSFNTVWQAIPLNVLKQDCTYTLEWMEMFKACFKSSIRSGNVVKLENGCSTSPFLIGSEFTYSGTDGSWTENTQYKQAEKIKVNNETTKNRRLLLSIRNAQGLYDPFFTSKQVMPNTFIEGSPVIKLGIEFETSQKGTFIGEIRSENIFEIDFTGAPENTQTLCIDTDTTDESEVMKMTLAPCPSPAPEL